MTQQTAHPRSSSSAYKSSPPAASSSSSPVYASPLALPSSSSSSSSSPSSSSSSSHFEPHQSRVKTTGCKGKKIVECNTTPGCKFTTGNKRNFCRTIKNATKLTLNGDEMEALIAEIRDLYPKEKQLQYVIGRIRKSKCKFVANYKGASGRKFVGDNRVYEQAIDKIHYFFRHGSSKIF